MNNDSDAEIGYGKPPKRTRFQRGTSGNPKGRPKGKRNFGTVLAEALQEKIVIKENGQRKIVTKLEAAVTQLANKAAAGDLIALRQLTVLVRSVQELAVEPPTKELSEDDLKIMRRVLQRQATCADGDPDESH
jgi:hypothetical protein